MVLLNAIDNTINKTAARSDWGLEEDEVNGLTPIKVGEVNLSDVIALAHNKRARNSYNGVHISAYVKDFPEREMLYARYLHDQFQVKCRALEDHALVKAVYDAVRSETAMEAQKTRLALKIEET
jgi:hypothetical protein